MLSQCPQARLTRVQAVTRSQGSVATPVLTHSTCKLYCLHCSVEWNCTHYAFRMLCAVLQPLARTLRFANMQYLKKEKKKKRVKAKRVRGSRRKPSARRFARGDYWKRCAKPVLVTPTSSLCFPLTRCPLACCAPLQFLTHFVMMCVACCGWHSFGCACTHPLVLQPAAYTPPASWSPPQCVGRHRGAACRDALRKAATKASRSRPVQPQKERDALRDQKES